MINVIGCGERFGASHTVYFQCTFGLPYILANICHYGSSVVCREIL